VRRFLVYYNGFEILMVLTVRIVSCKFSAQFSILYASLFIAKRAWTGTGPTEAQATRLLDLPKLLANFWTRLPIPNGAQKPGETLSHDVTEVRSQHSRRSDLERDGPGTLLLLL
jgi:hypothetical protein